MEQDFRSYEYYDIEMEDGQKVMHIFGCVWENDGREDGDYTVTGYTFCCIPIKDLTACGSAAERWDLIMDAEGSVQQYEEDYSWEDLLKEGYGSPDSPNGVISTGGECSFGTHLQYEDITADTPCGSYYYYW